MALTHKQLSIAVEILGRYTLSLDNAVSSLQKDIEIIQKVLLLTTPNLTSAEREQVRTLLARVETATEHSQAAHLKFREFMNGFEPWKQK
jgi:hypothetical protein